MALETYSLLEMRERIRAEFGIDTTSVVEEAVIHEKINDAVSEIVRRRQNWPWLRKSFFLDIPDEAASVGYFTRGSRSVAIDPDAEGLPSPAIRNVIVAGSGGTAGNVYTVTSIENGVATLSYQFLGTTGAHPISIRQAYTLLPDDFLRMNTAMPVQDLSDNYLFEYLSNADFEHFRRRQIVGIVNDYRYTVQTDPLSLDGKFYLALHPAPTRLLTITGNYFMVPPKMVEDADVPVIPLNDRPVALHWAMYFYARGKSDERAGMYLRDAEASLASMKDRYELSEDPPRRDRGYRKWEVPFVDVTENLPGPDYVSS